MLLYGVMKGVCPDGVYGVLAGYPNAPGVPKIIKKEIAINNQYKHPINSSIFKSIQRIADIVE